MPAGPANGVEILYFNIKKDLRKYVGPILEEYLVWFHEMRTGEYDNIADSAMYAWIALGNAVLLALYIIYKLLACICPCCKKKPT